VATGDNRRIIQAQALDLQKVNEALRHISEWLNKLEGRTGGVAFRDSIDVISDKQTIFDFTSNISGTGSICLFGTENATLALAKGARKENNGEWIATDTVAVIWALARSGTGTLYVNTGLTIGQAFEPTANAGIGTGSLTAAAIVNVPSGGIAATNVQTALNELDTEKANLASPTFTGTPTLPTGTIGVTQAVNNNTTALATTAFARANFARQPYSFRFSSGQLFGTGDTNLTSYDYTFGVDDLKVGDTLSLFSSVSWQTTAGTKTLTLTVGTGAARTMFSSAGVVANTLAHTRVDLFVRNTTTLAIEGFTLISTAGSTFTETYFINAGITVSDISANAQLFRWIGKNTGSATEAKMTDIYIRHFPANGNSAVV